MNYFVETIDYKKLEEFLQLIAANSGTDAVVSVCSDENLYWFKVIYKSDKRID